MLKLPALLFLVAATVAGAKTPNPVFSQIADQVYTVEKDQAAEQANDKKLQQSEQDQTFARAAEEKARTQLEQDAAKWEMDRAEANSFRQHIIDLGCPPAGGVGPIDLVNKCNPLVDQHTAMTVKLGSEAQDLKDRAEKLNTLRDNISATVLANSIERKRINGALANLATRLEDLRGQAIAAAIKLNPTGARRACGTACCHSVVYDGADPKLCGIGLICQSFQDAGLFGSGVVICGTASSTTPVQEASAETAAPPPAKTKKQWEIEYDQKMATYQIELAKQQQAVQQYQADMAAMKEREEQLKASAESAHAAWERAVAACKAGDYSQCAHQ